MDLIHVPADIFEPDASASELAAAGKWDESQQAATQLAAAALATIPSASLAVPTRKHTRRHSTHAPPQAAESPRAGGNSDAKPLKRKTVSTTNLGAAAEHLRSRHHRSVSDKPQHHQQHHQSQQRHCKEKKSLKAKEETSEVQTERNIALTSEPHDEQVKVEAQRPQPQQQQQQQQREMVDNDTTLGLRSLVDFWRGFATGLGVALLLLAVVFVIYLSAAATTSPSPSPSSAWPPSSASVHLAPDGGGLGGSSNPI
jgi:hypothetical protein